VDTPTRIARVLFVVSLLAGALAVGAAVPAAAAQECRGVIEDRTIKDGVVVPTGVVCELYNVVVRGGIVVQSGGGLVAHDSEIRGSVTGSNVLYAEINYSSVRGGVSILGATEGGTVAFAEVRGDVTITGAGDSGAFLQGATIRGSATLNDSVLVTVWVTTIGVNLSCTGNDAVTNRQGGNVIGGPRLGDCQNL
jgi:hypothetical protein